MKKVLIIESCCQCKHRSGYLGTDLCTKTNSKHSIEIRDMRVIPDANTIPEWCDLPDVQAASNYEMWYRNGFKDGLEHRPLNIKSIKKDES